MTEDEAIERIRREDRDRDVEGSHERADETIIQFLRELGYRRLAAVFDELTKWYG